MSNIRINPGIASIFTPESSGAIKKSPENIHISHIIGRIKKGEWKAAVEGVRLGSGKKNQNEKKKALPLVFFSGMFPEGTKNEDQATRSGYLCIDFDDNQENAEKDWGNLKDYLKTLPFVASYFESARGKGLKVVVRIPDDLEQEEAIEAIKASFSPLGFKIDPSPRAFISSYISYDPNAMTFREATPMPIVKVAKQPEENQSKKIEDLPFDELVTLFKKPISLFYNCGSGRFFNSETWTKYTEAQMWRELEIAGMPPPRKKEVLAFITRKHAIDEIVEHRSGHRSGYYNENGNRLLVRFSPKEIRPKEGNCDTILALLKSRFDDPKNPEQFHMLLAWIKRARLRLCTYLDAFSQGEKPDDVHLPVLEIVGSQGLGKSKIFKKIILPLLGGREANGNKILCEAAQFNSSLMKNEVIVIDDYEATNKFSRKRFAGKLKETLFASCAAIEGKNKDEVSSDRICPIVVQLLNYERIETTPDYYSIQDKVIFLNVEKYSELEEDKNGDFDAMNKAIDKELPAFAHYIGKFQIPKSVSPTPGNSAEQRIRMKLYVHPRIRELLEGNDKALNLLSEFDSCAQDGIADNFYGKVLTAGKIQELIGNRVKGTLESVGRQLRILHERFPTRVEQYRSGNQGRGWIIHPLEKT